MPQDDLSETQAPLAQGPEGTWRAEFSEGRDIDAVDVPGDSSTFVTLPIGGSYASTINNTGDVDWFAVALVQDESYAISLDSAGDDGLRDPFLRLYAPGSDNRLTGQLLAADDDGGSLLNARIAFTAEATGIYYIDASAYNDTSVGGYRVSIDTSTPPDNSLFWSRADIAAYLQSGYWQASGQSARAFDVGADRTLSVNIDGLANAPGFEDMAVAALQTWSDLTGLVFNITSASGADIVYTTAGPLANNQSQLSGGSIQQSIITIPADWGPPESLLHTFIHETGHALGLGHGGPYNNSAIYGIDNIYGNDSWQASVMSYFSQSENTAIAGTEAWLSTPMPADILAIRALYGDTTTIRGSDTVYGYNTNTQSRFGPDILDGTNGPVGLTIVDDAGVDTIDLSGSSRNNRIDLRAGAVSDTGGSIGTLAIGPATTIENAIGGSGNDTITGNAEENVLTGGLGVDLVDGGGGFDTAVLSGDMNTHTLRFGPQMAAELVDRAIAPSVADYLTAIEFLDFDAPIDLFGNQPFPYHLLDGAAQVTAADFALIAELYIAYFNRAPDAIGLYFWADQFAQGYSLTDMAERFFEQPETQDTYQTVIETAPDGSVVLSDIPAFVAAVYTNVLGRDYDQEGFDFWVNVLTTSLTVTPANFILAILEGANNPVDPTPQRLLDQAYLQTKTDLGLSFAATRGMSDVDAAQDLALFDGSAESVSQTLAAFDGHYETANQSEDGAFLMQLIGIFNDPFMST